MALKDWKKIDRNVYNNKRLDKHLIIQEGSNKIIIIDWKTGKRQETASAPNRQKAVSFAKNYMKKYK